ncbi:Hypothetical predicted protein [Octopus vulgaris]|uniref:Uncharacterized protein n=1 Tax=Octopus vulgaris TaxID=6645 RepID=A0AA36BAR4_OCTVU|nr:Hypothetical predicted protein [Octopus vulgaris]
MLRPYGILRKQYRLKQTIVNPQCPRSSLAFYEVKTEPIFNALCINAFFDKENASIVHTSGSRWNRF